jgi:hypothetical protein
MKYRDPNMVTLPIPSEISVTRRRKKARMKMALNSEFAGISVA